MFLLSCGLISPEFQSNSVLITPGYSGRAQFSSDFDQISPYMTSSEKKAADESPIYVW